MASIPNFNSSYNSYPRNILSCLDQFLINSTIAHVRWARNFQRMFE